MNHFQKIYDQELKETGSPKKARRAVRHAIAKFLGKYGFSRGLRARATSGALRGYAKKVAINAVAESRRREVGGAQ